MELSAQIEWLFTLAIPIACIAWTVTHEDIFKEPREYCIKCSKERKYLITRKFFYLFTCEYCFSHYVTIAFLIITKYKLLFDDWRGYLIGGFALVWIANFYMGIFLLIRMGVKIERADASIKEEALNEKKGDTI
jgi:hypothetical protein